MRLTLLLAAAALLVCGSVVTAGAGSSKASSQKSASNALMKTPHKIEALNNVVTMDSDGVRTALCTCGKTFTVSDQSPTLVRGGTTFYFHSDECASAARAVPETNWDQWLTSWKAQFNATKFLSNARMKEGREVATCLCGKTFDVTSRTHAIAENGMVVHFCSEGCATKLHGLDADQRMKAELALLPSERDNQAHPSVEVIYRMTGESNAAMSSPSSSSSPTQTNDSRN